LAFVVTIDCGGCWFFFPSSGFAGTGETASPGQVGEQRGIVSDESVVWTAQQSAVLIYKKIPALPLDA
jgi:hypothetical protein